jgi:hypothetical protein
MGRSSFAIPRTTGCGAWGGEAVVCRSATVDEKVCVEMGSLCEVEFTLYCRAVDRLLGVNLRAGEGGKELGVLS